MRPTHSAAHEAAALAMAQVVDDFRRAGADVRECPPTKLLGADSEATTDGSHPSDLGAMRYAEHLSAFLESQV